jgi:hypothetical protein
MRQHFNTKWNARIPQLYRTQEDAATNLPLNLQLAKGMRVLQQDTCCILGAVYHGKDRDMDKRNTENLQ